MSNDVVLVLLEEIVSNPYQPRHAEDPAAIAELAESIKRNGRCGHHMGRQNFMTNAQELDAKLQKEKPA